MKISTRIVSGFGILILLIAALLAYQLVVLHRMQSINRTLSRVNFRAAITSLELMRDRDLVEEYTHKAFAVGDPAYLEQIRVFRESFDSSLARLKESATSGKERIEVDRLAGFWREFQTKLDGALGTKGDAGAPLPPALDEDLERLRAQSYTVYAEALRRISWEVERSARTGQTAEFISWCAAALALIFAGLVSFFIVRSIAIPLNQLTEGTRAIADGKFFYRLDTSRRDEFAQVARDFNTMTQRLGELDEMKRGFVSHVSHELKAPLASMRETIQLLLEQIPGTLNEKQRRLLELNLESNSRLASIIGNLLDLSRMEAGVMEYNVRTQEMAPLARSAIAAFEEAARQKGIRFVTDVPDAGLVVECDPDRMVQAIGHLIGNAVKFSPRSSTVRIAAQRRPDLPEDLPKPWRERLEAIVAPTQSYALLSVTDSGPGIPDPQKEIIFERFHQLSHGRKLQGQGVGLGLAIARTIVEAHRGALWVEDNPSGGSTFYLLLRAAQHTIETQAAAS